MSVKKVGNAIVRTAPASATGGGTSAPAREVGQHRHGREDQLQQDLEDQLAGQPGGLHQDRRQDVDAEAGVVGVRERAQLPVLGVVGEPEGEELGLDVVAGDDPAAQRGRQQQAGRDQAQGPDVAAERPARGAASPPAAPPRRPPARRARRTAGAVVEPDRTDHGQHERQHRQGLRELEPGLDGPTQRQPPRKRTTSARDARQPLARATRRSSNR